MESNDPMEIQYEEYHNNPPIYTKEELKRKRDEINGIGKKFIDKWINIRFNSNLDMQIQTEENGEWITVVRFSDIKNDNKST